MPDTDQPDYNPEAPLEGDAPAAAASHDVLLQAARDANPEAKSITIETMNGTHFVRIDN